MMDMLKAYAHQVVSYHPAAQRDEEFAEIYDSLCEEYADQKSENPDLGEQAFLNACKPHPMKYATQLAADDSAYLVGPQFYFSFLSSLKIALSIVVVFHIVIAVVTALASGHLWASFWNAVSAIPESMLWVGAAVLGVFVALEKSGEKATWLDKWDASELRGIEDHQLISRGEIAFELVFSSFALLWILDIVQLPVMVRHDGAWIRDWAVSLPDWVWPLAGLLLVIDIVFSVYRLTRTLWTRNMRLITVVTQVLWIALLAFVASQSGFLSTQNEEAAQLLPIFENVIRGSLMVAIIIIAWDTLGHVRRLLRSGGFAEQVGE